MIMKAVAEKDYTLEKDESKFISVIVAAKNEGKKIGKLLESFSELDYPNDKYEIIVVDDNSEDDTLNIIESYKGRL